MIWSLRRLNRQIPTMSSEAEHDLVRAGVPKEDIVLAFHDPETHKETEFAAA